MNEKDIVEQKENYEQEVTPSSAVFKTVYYVIIACFGTEAPLFLWLFDIVSGDQLPMWFAVSGLLTIVPLMLLRHQQIMPVTGILFFAPFTYWKRPGVVLPDDQAQILGKIKPLREGVFAKLLSNVENPVDTTMKEVEDRLNRSIPGGEKVKVSQVLFENVLAGKTFEEVSEELHVTPKLVSEWWTIIGGFKNPEEISSILKYPNRYLVWFEKLTGLDGTILCSKKPFSQIGTPQERDGLQFNGWFVKGRALPIALHELRAFNYGGARMSITVVGSCDNTQAEIIQNAGVFNVPNPDNLLIDSAKKDFDKGYVGLEYKMQLRDAQAHINSFQNREEEFDKRVDSRANSIIKDIVEAGYKPGRLARLSGKTRLFIGAGILLIFVIGVLFLINLGVILA